MQANPALWQAINAYDIDAADAAFPFSRRLARDNGWTQDFANRAIAEYKRFIYLCCVSGHTLTPSEEIDSVWHLHLIYTQDYWDRFCAETLQRKVHHGPTKGGQAEADKYRTCYQRTLDAYRSAFSAEPPQALWPEEAIRFSPDRYQRIDVSTHIILPKRQVFLCLAAGITGLALAGCSLQSVAPYTPHLILWGAVALAWLFLTWVNIKAIAARGLMGYIFPGVLMVPVFSFFIGFGIERGLRIIDIKIGFESAAAIGAVLATLLWIRVHTQPGGNGSGSGCGSGCGGGGSGCSAGSGCGGGGGCGGGCGGGD